MKDSKIHTVDNSLFNGVFAATLIPMHRDLSCNEQELANHCQELIRRGCRGIVLFGTTGEGPSFSVEERKYTLKSLIALGFDPKRIILGICCSSMTDAVSLAQAAIEANCLGVLVSPPFFYKNVKEEGVIAFYRAIIQRTSHPDLKMILYHIPQYSGVALNHTIIQTLREEFPDIVVGMKDSEGNLPLIKEVIEKCPGFNVLIGRELFLWEGRQLGAVGGILGIANLFPELMNAIYESGDHKMEMSQIMEILKNYPIFAALKSLIEDKKGPSWHSLRPPLFPLDLEQRRILIKALSSYF